VGEEMHPHIGKPLARLYHSRADISRYLHREFRSRLRRL
jgi:hypothetical protein